ncbi:MAG: SLC13 family permease, partial [Planctomycetota bacterium]
AMTWEIFAVLCMLGGALVLFASELLAVDLVAILLVLALVFSGLLDIHDALLGFGHPAVIGVGALFIISEGLLRTGALGILANRLERWSRSSERRLTVLLLVIVAVSSAFLNNTPVVAMFIPVVLGLCLRIGINPSRLLLPLSYAAILGGTCTLIGTSTNLVVASLVAEREGLRALGMFEFTGLGVILSVSGILYLLFIRRRIPPRQTITSLTAGPGDRRMREYVTELEIRAGGSFAGRRFGETPIAEGHDVRVIQIIRGEEILWPPFAEVILEEGDALVISGKIEDLIEIQREEGLASLEEILSSEELEVEGRETELAEILVLPNSPFAGQTLEQARFRSHFGVNVVAIQRHGMHLRKKIFQHPLRIGDLLLVQGTAAGLGRVGSEEGLVLMAGVEDVIVRRRRAPIALGILSIVVVLLSLRLFHMATVALTGAVAMILSGCLPVGKVYKAIHWRVLILIAGTLALGRAMETTGTAEWLAHGIVDIFELVGPRGLVVVILVMAALLTECISNTAVAAVLIPVALQVAAQAGVAAGHEISPYPFVMAVAYGASCSFLTPIGYQTNTLVYGAGGYRFADFLRLGAPLVLVVWTLGGLLIPAFWPL